MLSTMREKKGNVCHCRKELKRLHRAYKNTTDRRFTVEATADLNADQLQLPTLFRCEIAIPEANYTSVREYVFNGEKLRMDSPFPSFSSFSPDFSAAALSPYIGTPRANKTFRGWPLMSFPPNKDVVIIANNGETLDNMIHTHGRGKNLPGKNMHRLSGARQHLQRRFHSGTAVERARTNEARALTIPSSLDRN